MSLGIGGRFLQPATVDYKEKQLLNIVEEMSIASSIVTPFIFILDKEKCINSMIFGETKDDAVLVITGGFLAHLSRDEMQGVVAHEFSHIFNFDLKMNKRVLVLSGLFPSIFAALIRSSISREREYLADASAVQYTRNPLGLAGALKKIRALSYGAWVQSLGVKPEKYSHMFFSSPFPTDKKCWFTSHPPLLERIKFLEPSFDGDYSKVNLDEEKANQKDSRKKLHMKEEGVRNQFDAIRIAGLATVDKPLLLKEVIDQISTTAVGPSRELIHFSAVLLDSIPESVKDAAHDTHDSIALVYGLALDKRDKLVRGKQLNQVEAVFGEQMAKRTVRLHKDILQLDPRVKLPLAEMAVASLRHLSADQFSHFKQTLTELTEADDAIDLFEFSLSKLVVRNLELYFSNRPKKLHQVYSLKKLGHECSVILSSLAATAGADEEGKRKAYKAGEMVLVNETDLHQLTPSACGLRELGFAMEALANVGPNQKKKLLEAAAAAVSADGYLQIQEAELLRAISDSLDCPMPPLAITLDTAA